MKLSTKTAAVAGAAVLAVTGIAASHALAHRDGGGQRGAGMVRQLVQADANRDGRIELKELQDHRASRFQRFDADGDGVLSEQEVETGMLERARERISRRVKFMTRRLDADQNGEITEAEFSQHAAERFRWRDLDDNGVLEGRELPRKARRALRRASGSE